MTEVIRVGGGKGYDVAVGRDLLDDAGQFLGAVGGARKALVVSDSNVWPLYGKKAEKLFRDAGMKTSAFVFEAGEKSKTLETFGRILDAAATEKLTRSDVIVALGGGVTGDLAGFASAVYLRGVRCVQIPTTLLAAVDSSVGGKTGVDLPAGKNLAGAFHRPSLVLCDTSTLDTLPDAQYRSGCAEVIKYGMIGSEDFLRKLIARPVSEAPEEVISFCVRMKKDVVEKDEFDVGCRMLLNFGHTFGHAAELLSGYSISHGEGVAAGMATVTRAAVKFGICDGASLELLLSALEKYNLPRVIPFRVPEMRSAVLSDKKNIGGELKLIVPEKAGKCAIRGIDPASVGKWISAGRTSGWNRQK